MNTMKVKPGDRVKLTSKAVSGVMKMSIRRNTADWINRRGTVRRTNAYSVMVLWDGLTSLDPWPIATLEVIDD